MRGGGSAGGGFGDLQWLMPLKRLMEARSRLSQSFRRNSLASGASHRRLKASIWLMAAGPTGVLRESRLSQWRSTQPMMA